MSTRRQPSSTSLSKYARAHSPDYADRSYDFCNAFWGLGDAGVDVLFTRMRGAIRTVDEIRNFWKERANIEDQYARKLAALAKVTLGRDEIGELRNCLDTLRSETAKQAEYHNVVAEQIKKDLEGSTTAFLSKQMQHKKTYQAQIEKELKVKQQQEAHVSRAREKYESDCTKINSYTAQSTLLQGRELEKVQQKLRNTQQTITANERDFAQFSRELKDTVAKWEVSWKAFCDTCQDLEEERTEFMKDYMWAYANAISTVCVSDDEACEKMRLSLELLEPERDMENFVRDYGTGNAIPEPPTYVSYSDPTAVPSSSQRPNTHLANFERRTQRSRPPVPPTEPPEEDPAAAQNTAGIGAGGGRSDPPMSRSRSASRASLRNLAQAQAVQDRSQAQPAPPLPVQPMGSAALTNGTGSNTARGPEPLQNGYDGDRGVSARPGPTSNGGSLAGNLPVKVGQDDDPLAMQLAELQKDIGSQRGSQRVSPSAQQRSPSPAQRQPGQTHQPRESASQLVPPPGSRGGGPPNKVDYRRSAEIVVGAFPTGIPSSRPASPNPPTPVMAMPPQSAQTQNGVSVQNVLADYQQSFPGERKSVSRPGSRAGSFSGSIQQPSQQAHQAPRRPESMAGIGAQGRSPSPQPFVPPSRAASPMHQRDPNPAIQQPVGGVSPNVQRGTTPNMYQPAPPPSVQQPVMSQARRNSMRVPPPTGAIPAVTNGTHQQHPARHGSISVPQAQPQRTASPNPVGIALDQSGRVAMDVMAEEYISRQPSVPPQQQAYRQPMQSIQQVPQRAPSYPPPTQPPYGAPPPGPAPGYGPVPGYVQQAQPPQQMPPQQQPVYGQQQYPQYGQPPPQDYGRVNVQRQQSMNAQPPVHYYPNMQAPPQQIPQHQQQLSYGRAVSPMRPPEQPRGAQQQQSPTGAYTDDGRPILFYVKALYDYQASIDEEFDFQTGDIIAVTATPEDGWWSGELLDEMRRQPGRHVFPSNFVDLLN